MASDTLDLTRGEIFDNPHPVYSQMQQAAPVQWNDSLRGWVLTRHADVKAALKDSRLSVEKLQRFSQRVGGDPHSDLQHLARALSDWMVFKDPPRHALLRRSMQNAFMARDVPILEPMIQAVVDELLDDIAPRGDERRRVEFLGAFANIVPSVVIADLFGMPREERSRLNQWSMALGEFVLGSTDSPDRRQRAATAVQAMSARFKQLVDQHRADNRDDFTALLIRDGAHLTDDEIVHTLILVLFAGHETTANLIASGVLTLLRAPSLLERLVTDSSLVASAIEEFLRLEGPVQMVFRIAKEDVEYAGVRIPAGDTVHLVLNAANRDPSVFDKADQVDLERRRFQHVSFGPGTHMCLGAPLARLIGGIALSSFLGRFDRFELEDESPRWRHQLIAHGLNALPISYQCRSSVPATQ